ncbi:MAG: hypothetical protein IJP98_02355 [Clostridia bacterium]|nr:hypothetical protein [Clostridia bacterium]
MKGWSYTDGELRTMYRDAKDKRAQIKIIQELCCRSREEVIEKLRSIGLEVEDGEKRTKPKKKRKAPNVVCEWTPETIEEVRQLAATGVYINTICRRMHVGEGRLRRMMDANGITCTKYGEIPDAKKPEIRRLLAEGLPPTRVARMVHVSPAKLRDRLADFLESEAL